MTNRAVEEYGPDAILFETMQMEPPAEEWHALLPAGSPEGVKPTADRVTYQMSKHLRFRGSSTWGGVRDRLRKINNASRVRLDQDEKRHQLATLHRSLLQHVLDEFEVLGTALYWDELQGRPYDPEALDWLETGLQLFGSSPGVYSSRSELLDQVADGDDTPSRRTIESRLIPLGLYRQHQSGKPADLLAQMVQDWREYVDHWTKKPSATAR